MPVVHVGADRAGPVRAFVEGLEPQPNEAIFPAPGGNAFAGTGLEQRLEAGGHTTLVICGAPTDGAVAMTARHAGGLGFRVFVAADACWTVERTDPYGGTWPADTVHRVALAGLHDAHAAVVDARSACEAAALIASRRK
jgi:nicotinamidase-related amidase